MKYKRKKNRKGLKNMLNDMKRLKGKKHMKKEYGKKIKREK